MMKVEARQSTIDGTGVFATEEMPGGANVLEIDDSRIVDHGHPGGWRRDSMSSLGMRIAKRELLTSAGPA
jgi:hypothetical protein